MADKALITKEVLRWARETARFSIENAASKINISEKKLHDWESSSSEEYPSIKQAEKLAKLYRRPLAVFYLPSIPKDFQTLRDFRSRNKNEFSTALIFMMREIQEKQYWLKNSLIETGESQLDFVGKFSSSNPPDEVAEDIRVNLNINTSELNDNPLKYWSEKAESKRIFISFSSFFHTRMKLDLNEVKGFAIADNYAPFIFVNSHDWKNAKLFTLVHELAHLWINESGVSNETEIQFREDVNLDPVEKFCNEVAANTLLPENEFKESFERLANLSLNNISMVSRKFGVSNITLLIRAYKLDLINDNEYNSMKSEAEKQFLEYERIMKRKEELQKKKDGGPSFYLLQAKRNGKAFSSIVLDNYKGGFISGLEASQLLNVKLNKFPKLEKFIY